MGGAEPIRRGDLVAVLDQAGAALRDVAQMLGGYRRDLIDAGFPTDDALEMCIEAQRHALFETAMADDETANDETAD